MPNIMINNNCNLKCSYCFAEDCKKEHQEMDLVSFSRALTFITRYHNNIDIGIIGGEPTIHKNIKDFLKTVIMNNKVRTCTLFTNGIKLLDIIDYFENNEKMYALLNFNGPDVCTENQMTEVIEALDEFNKRGLIRRIDLGINLFKPDQNIDYVIDACKRYNMKFLRLSVTVPNNDNDRFSDQFKYFESMKSILLDLVFKCLENDIEPRVDCNYIPNCIFTDEEIDVIKEKIGNKYCNLLKVKNCNPVIDIMPDLSITRCFGMSDLKININEVESLDQVNAYFLKNVDYKLCNIEATERCKNCKEYKFNTCSGGCLAYKLKDGGLK